MSAPEIRPDYAVSWRFLQRFHPGRLIVVTAISLDRQKLPTETFSADEEAKFLGWVESCGKSQMNLYFSVAEPLRRFTKKMERTDCLAVHYLHIDVDPRAGEDLQKERERIRALLQNPPGGLPPPSIIVYSGGGYQAYWRLAAPLPVNGKLEVAEELKLHNLHIERILGADNCHNVDRVMRLPGSINVPDAKKLKKGRTAALAEVVEFHENRIYSIDLFPKAVDGTAPREATPTGAPALPVSEFANEPKWDEIEPAIVDSLDGLGLDDSTIALARAGDVDEQIGRPGDQSDDVFHFVGRCLRAKPPVPFPIILGLLLNRTSDGSTWRISEHVVTEKDGSKRKNALRYARRQLKRVWQDEAKKALDGANETARHAGDFTRDEDGAILPTQYNIRVGLQKLGASVAYDEHADLIILKGLAGFGPFLDDNAATFLRMTIDEQFGFRPGDEFFNDTIVKAALDNRVNPPRDYFDSLEWDGTPRLGRWLVEYCGAEDTEFNRAVGEIVLTAAVRRVRSPGCKFDELMVWVSDQGTNKSTALSILAVRPEWFCDELPLGASTKELMEVLEGVVIAEAAELQGLRRSEIENVKAFASRQTDKARLAYGRHTSRRPRRFIIIGTTNSQTFLRDSTGNRRFWPVKVGTIDLQRLKADRDLLWAEAAVREESGASIRLDPSLWAAAGVQQKARAEVTAFDEFLEPLLGAEVGKVWAPDLWLALGKPSVTDRRDSEIKAVGASMQKLGWTHTRRRKDGRMEYCYVRGSDEAQERVLRFVCPDGTWRVEADVDLLEALGLDYGQDAGLGWEVNR